MAKVAKQTKAVAAKQAPSVMDEVVSLAEQYKELDLAAKAHEEEAKVANKAKMEVSRKLCELAERAELQPPFRLASGGSISIRTEMATDIQDRDAMFHWLTANGHGEIIQSTVHHQTLKSLCKELEGKNQPYPPGVEVKQYQRAVYLKK